MNDMDIREYYAGQALPALIQSSVVEPGRIASAESIANLAFIFADAMVEQMFKETIDTRQKEEK